MPKPITHVATTDMAELMAPGTERRMDLPGFDTEFVDFPHYIIRITDRIWHDREVGLCLKWYTPDCLIHTLGGDVVGAQTVVDNTWATLKSFPDRRLDADNVIWSQEDAGTFYSSHLITSKMTNMGPSEFGPATGRSVRIQTIADCLCRDNRIFREWLVRDNFGLVLQLGLDANSVAQGMAEADRARGFDLKAFHASDWESKRGTSLAPPHAQPAATAHCIRALETLWQAGDWTCAPEFYDFRAAAAYPGSASLYGPDQIGAYMRDVLGVLSDLRVRIDHAAEIPYLGDAKDVALRWSITGTHTKTGRYGAPSGAPVFVLGVSQFRVMNGRIREETCIWDDLAVRRQIAAARL
jgi:hypothetical protein